MRSGAAVALEESESVRPSESESQIELQQLKGLRGVSVHWHIVSSTTKARKPAASLKSKTMKAAKPMKATKAAKASQSVQRYSWVHVRVPLSRPRRGFRWKDATPALVAAAEGSAAASAT